MDMPGRSVTPIDDYKYGFNGKEEDKWNGNHGAYADFGARMYDERLGRWMSTDAHQCHNPGISPYSFSYNNPIIFNDPDGNDGRLTVVKNPDGGGSVIMETTIHIYGKDAKQKKAYLVELYKKYASNTKTFKDIHGKEWDVTLKVNFDDVNSEAIENQIKINGLDESQVPIVNFPGQPNSNVNPSSLKGFKEGDNILQIDFDKHWPDGGGEATNNGAAVGSGASEKTYIHEILHLLGFSDQSSDGGIAQDIMDGGPLDPSSILKLYDYHYEDLLYYGIEKGTSLYIRDGVTSPNNIDDIKMGTEKVLEKIKQTKKNLVPKTQPKPKQLPKEKSKIRSKF